MEIIKVQLNTTLKCGRKVWEAGVYMAPVPPDILAERYAGTRTRDGVPVVEVLAIAKPKVVPRMIPFRSLESPTTTSNVTTSNLREGPIFEVGKNDSAPQEERKEQASSKPKLVLRR